MSQHTPTSKSDITADDFDYLLDKISDGSVQHEPFTHLEIQNFLKSDHFDAITNSEQIALRSCDSDRELVRTLQENGYEPIPFPGTVSDVEEYLAWRNGAEIHRNKDTCAGFGITFRLEDARHPVLEALLEFVHSEKFMRCLCDRFDLEYQRVQNGLDTGIQKYLDGYEISPHPDVRKKALTYMLNLNPGTGSEEEAFHTHYMELEDRRKYVEEYWKHNPQHDRCWVPWDWARTLTKQVRNNSIVLFSPSHDTLHAVRANYDHLSAQRTQLYGNFWYDDVETEGTPQWQDFLIDPSDRNGTSSQLSWFWRKFKKGIRNPAKVWRKISPGS
jgi:hypothetical protein